MEYKWVKNELKPEEHLAELHSSLTRLRMILEKGMQRNGWTKKDLIDEIETAREHLYRSGFKLNNKYLYNPMRRRIGIEEE